MEKEISRRLLELTNEIIELQEILNLLYSRLTSALAPQDGQILLPHDNGYNLLQEGEWDYSNIVIPNFGTPGNNFDAKIFGIGPKVGGVGGGFSLVQLYADSRSTPFSPDP